MHELMRLENQPEMDLQPISVSSMLMDLVKDSQKRLEERQLHVSLDIQPNLPFIMADEEMLARALSAILKNAMTHTPAGGQITLSAFQQASEICLRVSDSGKGMSEEVQQHIFERFYRADDTRNTSTGGAGLGLSITKHIVEAHQGRIEVSSHEGEGSCFTICLPLLSAKRLLGQTELIDR